MTFLRMDSTTLVLAPMQGVMDVPMRALIADLGGFDYAVSEFIRVGQRIVNAQEILHAVPDLNRPIFDNRPLPIQLQLLGDSPEWMAGTAVEGCIAGAGAIDLNFGCPAPTILRRSGGASLLRTPCALMEIVRAVRRALPMTIPVSAKVRLGWDDPQEIEPIARAVEDGGASWITIHARTKREGYQPGVHWDAVARARAKLTIPVIANGDLFSADDVVRGAAESGCSHFMVGRGILRDPFLAHDIRAAFSLPISPATSPSRLRAGIPSSLPERLQLAIERYVELTEDAAGNSGFIPSRVKQWISIVREFSDSVPREISSAVKRARTGPELVEMMQRR